MEPGLLAKWLRYYGLFKPLALLPLPLAYRGAGYIGHYDYRRQHAARTAIAQGLRQAFPEQSADPATLERWLAAYFAMLARETLDAFYLPRLSRGPGRRLIELCPGSLEVLQTARGNNGRGVILALCHFGRLNMLLLRLALAGEQLGMLTMVIDERNRQLDSIERAYLTRKVTALHRALGGRWLTLGDDLRALYTALAGGETIVILLDAHTPERPQRKLSAPFLGGTLTISRGIARLAEKTGARIVYGVAKERGAGYVVEAELRALPESPEPGLRAAVAELEKDVRAAPWLWWQWGVLDYIWAPPGMAA